MSIFLGLIYMFELYIRRDFFIQSILCIWGEEDFREDFSEGDGDVLMADSLASYLSKLVGLRAF